MKPIKQVGQAVGLIPEVPDIKLPAPVAAPQVDAAQQEQNLPDPEAKRIASAKLAQEKLRKGRKNLRIDLAGSSQGVGAGVAIPV